MITIIDYGAGNIKSIQNMFRKLGVQSIIGSGESEIEKAEKIIIPGVGHFDHGMRNLEERKLIDVLNKKALIDKTPILGICLGAQLLGNSSEEGAKNGLGWIPMSVDRFDKSRIGDKLKIPHMGWNHIVKSKSQENHPLFKGMEEDARFYFVHTYHMNPVSEEHVLTTTKYGYGFVSSVVKDNIYGVQFHPEKSHIFGMQLLQNFASI